MQVPYPAPPAARLVVQDVQIKFAARAISFEGSEILWQFKLLVTSMLSVLCGHAIQIVKMARSNATNGG